MNDRNENNENNEKYEKRKKKHPRVNFFSVTSLVLGILSNFGWLTFILINGKRPRFLVPSIILLLMFFALLSIILGSVEIYRYKKKHGFTIMFPDLLLSFFGVFAGIFGLLFGPAPMLWIIGVGIMLY